MARSTHHSGQQYTESSLRALGKQVEWVLVSTPQQHSLQVRALGTAIRHVTSKTGSGGKWRRMRSILIMRSRSNTTSARSKLFQGNRWDFPSHSDLVTSFLLPELHTKAIITIRCLWRAHGYDWSQAPLMFALRDVSFSKEGHTSISK